MPCRMRASLALDFGQLTRPDPIGKVVVIVNAAPYPKSTVQAT
jgi:hypothetical protein